MNVVKEINSINQAELDLGLSGASWHDEYRDSAYVFVGGLPFGLTEGDVIAIFSQYGEIVDLNMPRDRDTGKTKGFGFLMYEDQRSTILAVDNLNGAIVLEKTLRVDHVKNYKQPKVMNDDGQLVDPEEQSFNAKPTMIQDDGDSDSSASTGADIDPEDPMRDYLIAQRKEAKALKKAKKSKGEGKHKDETPDERRARKVRKKQKKEKKSKSLAAKGVEDLLNSLGRRDIERHTSGDSMHGRRDQPLDSDQKVRSPIKRRSRSRERYIAPDGEGSRRPSRYSDDEGNTSHRPDSRGRSSRDHRHYD
ncbi:hypothetical protein B0H34DRAFT_794066 [Crassisporium funariophilum]|nr:hypothetical protein B0H34DRAFT_794066 [Crassisporium funariophilum]